MTKYMLTDAITCIDSNIIDDHILEKERILKAKARNLKIFKQMVATAACIVILFCIPMVYNLFYPATGSLGDFTVSLSDVKYMGTPISQAEIDAFIAEHQDFILSSVSELSGINVQNLHIINKPLHHVGLVEGANYINYDVVTLYVLNQENKIVSAALMIRSDDCFVLNINGPCRVYERLNEVLEEYPQEDIVMICVNIFTEAAVTPDGKVHFLTARTPISTEIDYYSLFNKSINVLNSGMLE